MPPAPPPSTPGLRGWGRGGRIGRWEYALGVGVPGTGGDLVAAQDLHATAARKRRGYLITILLAFTLAVVALVAVRLSFHALWDGGGDLRVRGVVVNPEGIPIAHARVTLILNPGDPGFQLTLRYVARANAIPASWSSKSEPGAAAERVSSEIGLVRTDESGSIDIVVGIWLGGTTDEPGEMPPCGGIVAVIAEADGYETAYLSARSGTWKYIEHPRGGLGRLDLGKILLKPATQVGD